MEILKKISIISIPIIFLLIVGWSEKVYAVIGGISRGSPGGATVHVPTVPHPPVPRQFFNRWSITEVINSFQGNGLEIANIKPVTDEDYSSLPAKPEQGIKFSILSLGEDVASCILSFEIKGDIEKVKNHYLGLNKRSELHSWSFVKDNILLILDGKLPEGMARDYEKALYDLKK